jgi:hypothetical protein
MSRCLSVLLCLLLVSSPAAAQPAIEPIVEVEEAVDDSIERGVAFLLSRRAEDGRLTRGGHVLAITALSGMALLAAGHQAADPTPEGEALRGAIDFVTNPQRQRDDGYLGGSDGSRMYGHGIATLFLSEVAGMSGDAERDARVAEALEAAVALILRSQESNKRLDAFEGGWRYQPGSNDSDLSVSVWQVMALRSAESAGVDVPASAIDRAVAYLERSYRQEPASAAGAIDEMGRFGYFPVGAGRGDFSLSTTSAGLLAMQVCGEYDATATVGAAAWLHTQALNPRSRWFFYGLYYYATGMDQRGGEMADDAAERVAAVLLPIQREDGSWRGGGPAADEVYATSLAVLSLSVRYHYLPIYQR